MKTEVSICTVVLMSLSLVAHAGPIVPTVDKDGNVSWGSGNKTQATDATNHGVSIFFQWTKNNNPDPDYADFSERNNTEGVKVYHFILPLDPTITDWTQIITRVDTTDGASNVSGGNIKQKSPWAFYPLDELDLPSQWRIPDLAPLNVDQTIYAAVNLPLYYAANPLGPLGGNYRAGQTLDELGIEVTDGVIAGVSGLYLATTSFELDPNSVNGWVPVGGLGALLNSATYQSQNGPIAIIAIHEGTPEPATLLLVATSLLGVMTSRIVSARRKLAIQHGRVYNT